ncbi:MAG: hypothetical protein ACJAVB_000529 [Cyclobacteriaceae bacterium]|jgi:hypothetical protein
MKKALMVSAGIVGVIILTLILAPIIFKEDIRKAIEAQIDETVEAKLLYNVESFSVSLIKNFPDLSVQIDEVGIVGKGVFEGDTLFYSEQFAMTMDIMSVINGETIAIQSILLERPVINIVVMEDGQANYDIVKEREGPVAKEDDSEESSISITMRKWEIRDGYVAYIDQSLPYYLVLDGLDHIGSGDFSQDVFDMVSETTVSSFSTGYDGTEYITDKRLWGAVTLAMDLETFTFTFKENEVDLNDFAFSFEGFLSMPSSDIVMDLVFSGKEVDMKSMLSLTPGDYTTYLEGITTSGEVTFDGKVKGVYSDSEMPQVSMAFNVTDGEIAYQPYPIPMRDIHMDAVFDMPGADLTLASFSMPLFSMTVDGEKFEANLLFRDFEDYYWEFGVNGNVDLEKVTKIVPIGNMELVGKVAASLQTSGRMSDLDAERYQSLPTSGTLVIENLFYKSEDLPQGFGISTMDASFDPEQIVLKTFKGKAGKTDLNLTGKITNYLAYALSDDAILKGDLTFGSQLVDVNEWMTDDATDDVVVEDTSRMEVIRIPENISFVLSSKVDRLVYDDLVIDAFTGQLVIEGGMITMNQVTFGLLGGAFEMNGTYASLPEQPLYNYDLKIANLAIQDAFKSFNTVKKLAPFAEKMTGKINTDFKIGGALGSDMMPLYETIKGGGLLKIAEAAIKDVKLLSAVSNVTSIKQEDGSIQLKKVRIRADIEEGQVKVEPFDVVLAGYTTTITGSNSIAGQLSYQMKVKEVPTGSAGAAATSALSSLTGVSSLNMDKVDLNLGVVGTFLKPDVKLLGVSPAGSSSQASLKEEAKKKVTEVISQKKEEVKQAVDSVKTVAVDSAKAVINNQIDAAKDAAKKESEKAVDKAKEAAKDLFKKKKSGGGIL